jgi:hypothetical protein
MSRRGLFDAENRFNRGPLEPRELSSNGTKSSPPSTSIHNPSWEMLVTSAAEVAVPGIPDLLLVLDD